MVAVSLKNDNQVMVDQGWAGTSDWGLLWTVILLALVFEFMDASAGMGFGTALTPVLRSFSSHSSAL